jgi:hypothetical protein
MMMVSSCASESSPDWTSCAGRFGTAVGIGGTTAAIATLSTSGVGCAAAPVISMRCGA